MQSILTKFIPATNTKPSRIKASCERGSVTLSWPMELSGEAVHRWAVSELLSGFAKSDSENYGGTPESHHWGEFATGQIVGGEYVHVLLGRGVSLPA